MTAEEALASITEDIDRLEQKQVVKPGHIRRRRDEVAAIRAELATMEARLFQHEARISDMDRELQVEANRTSILANMLSIIGVPWRQRLEHPTDRETAILYRAARISSEHNVNTPDSNTPLWRLMECLRAAIMAARIEVGLLPIQHLIHTDGNEEEGRTAA